MLCLFIYKLYKIFENTRLLHFLCLAFHRSAFPPNIPLETVEVKTGPLWQDIRIATEVTYDVG